MLNVNSCSSKATKEIKAFQKTVTNFNALAISKINDWNESQTPINPAKIKNALFLRMINLNAENMLKNKKLFRNELIFILSGYYYLTGNAKQDYQNLEDVSFNLFHRIEKQYRNLENQLRNIDSSYNHDQNGISLCFNSSWITKKNKTIIAPKDEQFYLGTFKNI